MDTQVILYKLQKYQDKLAQNASDQTDKKELYQRKIEFYVNQLGGKPRVTGLPGEQIEGLGEYINPLYRGPEPPALPPPRSNSAASGSAPRSLSPVGWITNNFNRLSRRGFQSISQQPAQGQQASPPPRPPAYQQPPPQAPAYEEEEPLPQPPKQSGPQPSQSISSQQHVVYQPAEQILLEQQRKAEERRLLNQSMYSEVLKPIQRSVTYATLRQQVPQVPQVSQVPPVPQVQHNVTYTENLTFGQSSKSLFFDLQTLFILDDNNNIKDMSQINNNACKTLIRLLKYNHKVFILTNKDCTIVTQSIMEELTKHLTIHDHINSTVNLNGICNEINILLSSRKYQIIVYGAIINIQTGKKSLSPVICEKNVRQQSEFKLFNTINKEYVFKLFNTINKEYIDNYTIKGSERRIINLTDSFNNICSINNYTYNQNYNPFDNPNMKIFFILHAIGNYKLDNNIYLFDYHYEIINLVDNLYKSSTYNNHVIQNRTSLAIIRNQTQQDNNIGIIMSTILSTH